MERNKKLFFIVMFFVGLILSVNTQLLDKGDYIKIDNIGMNIISSNNIDKRFIFNFILHVQG